MAGEGTRRWMRIMENLPLVNRPVLPREQGPYTRSRRHRKRPSMLVGHLAALDRPAPAAVEVDLEATLPVDLDRGAASAVQGDAPAAEEVAGAEVDVDRVEPAPAPEVVVMLEPGEDPREDRPARALDAVHGQQRGRRDRRLRRQLLAPLVHVHAYPEHDHLVA